MYRVNNLLFVHTIFACIFGVKLKIFQGAMPPNLPFFLGGCTPQTPCSVIWKTPFKIPGYASEDDMYAISIRIYVHTYVIIPYKFLNFTSLNCN